LFYPRIIALNYTKATDLVGIDEAREELITRLTKEDDTSTEQRQVSIVGFGGLGKTALAKAVYNKLKAKGEFHCAAFVSMSRYPKLVEIFKELLYELDKTEYKDVISTPMEIDELINLVHEFLNKKRYARTYKSHYMFIPWKYPSYHGFYTTALCCQY
jgi:disease resistance protein RPM1